MAIIVEWSLYFLKLEHPSQENWENGSDLCIQKYSSLRFDE
jgi:hypothetical protein